MTSKITIEKNKINHKIIQGKPYILSNSDSHIVVVAANTTSGSKFSGTVFHLENNNVNCYHLGYYCDDWATEVFKPFIGTIELKEEG